MFLRISLFCCFIGIALPVAAKAGLIPAKQWTPQVRVDLAKAMVAEGGWESKRDHIAIAYVIARRWWQMSAQRPNLQFRTVLLQYAKGLGEGRLKLNPRQRWIRSLSVSLTEPDHWPANVRWSRHQRLWVRSLVLAKVWVRGRLPDPCRGWADHFGYENDKPTANMVEIDCGDTKNRFYLVRKPSKKLSGI